MLDPIGKCVSFSMVMSSAFSNKRFVQNTGSGVLNVVGNTFAAHDNNAARENLQFSPHEPIKSRLKITACDSEIAKAHTPLALTAHGVALGFLNVALKCIRSHTFFALSRCLLLFRHVGLCAKCRPPTEGAVVTKLQLKKTININYIVSHLYFVLHHDAFCYSWNCMVQTDVFFLLIKDCRHLPWEETRIGPFGRSTFLSERHVVGTGAVHVYMRIPQIPFH